MWHFWFNDSKPPINVTAYALPLHADSVVSLSLVVPPDRLIHPSRHLTVYGGMYTHKTQVQFNSDTGCLPSLKCIQFSVSGGVPWAASKICMSHPTIIDISILMEGNRDPFPDNDLDKVVLCQQISNGFYSPRYDAAEGAVTRPGSGGIHNIEAVFRVERRYLRVLAPGMHATAEVLRLPMEIAQHSLMKTVVWPHMRELPLYGKFVNRTELNALLEIIRLMPSLLKLSIVAAQPQDRPR